MHDEFIININNTECVTFAGYQFGYFIEYWDKCYRYTSDYYISKKIKIKLEDYKKIMIDKFNGCMLIGKGRNEEEIYFENTEDAQNACIWIESMMIMNKLNLPQNS